MPATSPTFDPASRASGDSPRVPNANRSRSSPRSIRQRAARRRHRRPDQGDVDVTTGQDEGVDAFNDFLDIVTRCLPDGSDPFTQSAYLWAGLHGYVALRQVIPTFSHWSAGNAS